MRDYRRRMHIAGISAKPLMAKRRHLRSAALAIVVVMMLSVSACSSTTSHPSQASVTSSTTPAREPAVAAETQAGLRSEAQTYAEAWLTGSASDLQKASGPTCLRGSGQNVAAALKRFRVGWKRTTGVATAKIKVRGVAVRRYANGHGQAAVDYDVPTRIAGNDNWLAYSYKDGRWQVSDCALAPIGGNSVGSSVGTARKP